MAGSFAGERFGYSTTLPLATLLISIQRRPRERLDVIDQPIQRVARQLFVTLSNRRCNPRMQSRRFGKIRRFLVMRVPESPRQTLHQFHRRCRIFVASAFKQQAIERPVMREKRLAVILFRRLLHLLGQRGEFGTLLRIGCVATLQLKTE